MVPQPFRAAPSQSMPSSPDAIHRQLAHFNRERLAPGVPAGDWAETLDRHHQLQLFEGRVIEAERAAVIEQAATAPTDPNGFIAWFEALRASGPGQHDPLFPWLAQHADLDAMKWFLTQEAAGEAGFDDLVAMSQVKMPDEPKLELANNYWDEMGRGHINGLHGRMLSRLITRLELNPQIETTVWESLALANTMSALASNRRYAYHSVGALGVVELTAPDRVAQVAAGLKRLGLPAIDRAYFDLHATLDVKHSQAWNRHVIRPLVAEVPASAQAMAEGALMRLRCGARCFRRYRAHLWAPVTASRTA